jgi:5-oxoprolinase (ATP-hydrolysing)
MPAARKCLILYSYIIFLNFIYVSHLPDITIITPVFDSKSKQIIFFTASRGHHADIGGILPGSMPPTSVNIFEEGAEIVDGGVFDGKGLVEYMVDKPSQYPGNSGCRNIRDVESDLKAVSNHHLSVFSSVSLTPA